MTDGVCGTATVPVTVVVPTYNEERNLPACLGSVAGWVHATMVVDSGSADRTRVIAAEHGARVFEHAFETHAKQWMWALQHLPIETEWVLGLDADQRVTLQLKEAIVRLFTVDSEQLQRLAGVYVNRRQIFRGQWIRHGGYYPKYLLKLFRGDRVRLNKNDLLDHHFHVDGPTAALEHDLIEANQNEDDLAFWMTKHRRYAVLLAREEFERRRNGAGSDPVPRFRGTPDEHTAWLKQRWYRMPLYIRPFLYFAYRYFVRMGFLDGKQGLIFHFLQGLWFRLLVDIHLRQLLTADRNGR